MLMTKPTDDKQLKEIVESKFDFKIPKEKYQTAWDIYQCYNAEVLSLVNQLGHHFDERQPNFRENPTREQRENKIELLKKNWESTRHIRRMVDDQSILEWGVYHFIRLSPDTEELMRLTWDYHPYSVKESKVKSTFNFELKDGRKIIENAYKDIVANESNDLGRAILTYINRWGVAIDKHLSEGLKLKDCWYTASNEADEGIGISGAMYGIAVNRLSAHHKLGEQIRKLHNGSYGEEYENIDGTVNPSVITYG